MAELFSVERLEQHGESLAAAQAVTASPRRGISLLPRITDNGRVLLASYRSLAVAIREERTITPAAEWLVDNFHIVDEQLREIRDDLPADYYRELPKLAEGPLAGYPRVYGLAWAYIAHTDSRFDDVALRRYVTAYQRVQPLTIGELWAIPISLRILLVENLRRLAEEIIRSRAARQQADDLADQLLGLGAEPANPRAMSRVDIPAITLPTAGQVQLFQRLRDQDPDVTPALGWLQKMLEAEGTTAEEAVRTEHQGQAAMNVTIRNVITTMRLIGWFDWQDFVESVSLVDQVLRETTSFAAMDFATRDRYRHAVEELARSSGRSEVDVAREAAAAAVAAPAELVVAVGRTVPADQPREPGYYLISGGRRAFERRLGVRPGFRHWVRRAYVSGATLGYLGTLSLVTAVILALPVASTWTAGWSGGGALLLLALALIPASDLAIALVNRFVTAVLTPRSLARLELKGGVPPELRTLVVVPTLLSSAAEIDALVGRLEVHYLANPEGDVRFALASDWLDADSAEADGDDTLLGAAIAGVERLNTTHGEAPGGGARFLLFHRRRTWDESERRWMGWERKRGKLHELNWLLRGSTSTSFLDTGRPISEPPGGIRYVVTLDSDTRLTMGTVTRLVGTMAHPLNRPIVDPVARRVVHGYGILQPRVTPTLPAVHQASVFQRVSSAGAGIDPYAAAVSDVYQDLFSEGTYTGKGIYDLDVFEATLDGRVADNTLLSHDLFEGIFAGAGLVADVELFDESPPHYLESAARLHRWARGDWQLLPWVLGLGRDAAGVRSRTAIPPVAHWKMVDNLRRTLSALAALATLVAAWTLPGVPAGRWTALILASIVIPVLLPVLAGLLPRRRGISKRSHLRAVGLDVAMATMHIALAVTFLAYQALLMLDAIGRTLVRLYVSRRHLLEWTTAAQARAAREIHLGAFYRRMAASVLVAVCTGLAVLAFKPEAARTAGLFVILWVLAPLIAQRVSEAPGLPASRQLDAAQRSTLRLIARRTWRFFETFVGPDDHALPPDNFQDDPAPVVAHRTSPTNIGVYLLAVVAARDFGWTGTLDTVERLEATLDTVARLDRYRGHLYNWYDTRDLHVLEPAYVSSVDSGNLAGHLIALAGACREMVDQPLPVVAALAGIDDALALTRRAAALLGDERRTQTITRRHLAEALSPGARWVGPAPTTAGAWADRLAALSAASETLADVAGALTAERGDDAGAELVAWAEATRRSVASHGRDAALLVAPGLTGHADGGRPVGQDAAGAPGLTATLAELSEVTDEAGEPTPGARLAAGLIRRLVAIADQAQALFRQMEFTFLFEPTRKLLSIGFQVRVGSLDPSFYDLLASEARLTSFIAIAKGDIEPSHWFRLGRALTPVGRGSALVSWSGSMFEYLMPSLVMRTPPGSLLEETCRRVVDRQIGYGVERGVPWGISESAYNARDLDRTYQYSSFGIPGLGLKRGLSDDLVVAPYATALAAMVAPQAAVRNLVRLRDAGAAGTYGFREALDYTPRRLPDGASVAVVNSYMAHHQGMALVAIGNVLHDQAMVERFHADAIIRATELLLQERMPRDVLVARPRAEEVKSAADVRDLVPPVVRRFSSPHDQTPRTHLLSNGSYAVMLTAAGSGYSRWGDIAVTRWREDVTCDSWGSWVYLRDMRSGEVWSVGHQPSGVGADSFEVSYAEDRAELARRDGSISTTMSIVVSGEHDAELRRVTLTNLGSRPREIELTSYAEIVLASQAADLAHPAFQNLFVQTEFVTAAGALLATRRRRAPTEPTVWAAHVVAVEAGTEGVVQYETDRARFLGRGRTARTALSVMDGRPLSNTAGAVLDPIFSLRHRVRLAPGATSQVVFSTVVADSREAVLDLVDKHREVAAFDRAATLAWTQAQVQLHHLGIDGDEALLFQRLATRIIYSDQSLRPAPSLIALNRRGANGLWRWGISGDLPIVVLRIDDSDDIAIVRQLLRAHEYWRMKLLNVDLVILNERGTSYAGELQEQLETLVRTSQSVAAHDLHEAHGAIFVLRGDQLAPDDRILLQSAARAVLLSRRGTLAEQVTRLDRPARPATPPPPRAVAGGVPAAPPARRELEFFNGLGGFADGGREYVTILGPDQTTPAPWINVIANEAFGFLVSESGSGHTWSRNSRENQLTPWYNDPVSDPAGEAILIRDEETGVLWGPTALPIRLDGSTYVAHHGRGYTRFEHEHDGIALTLVQLVPLDASVKVSRLSIENRSGRSRRLSVTAYAEWALGSSRMNAPQVVTELEPETGALLARNPWNTEFVGRVAFLDLAGPGLAARPLEWTADRTEFLGRNGALASPAGLARGHRLARAAGAGLDPCAVLQAGLDLAPGARTEIVVLLGDAADADGAIATIRATRAADLDAVEGRIATFWDDTLMALQVRTPDRSMDIMLNGWLLYQTIACRLWARAGFYQAGGAYGFRDQLQDVAAVTTARRDLTRAHLLRAAGRQFPEGDVQHWWHPPSGRGVRTRISDDRLWLPWAVTGYLAVTADAAVLDEPVPFIEGAHLRDDQEDAYYTPDPSAETVTLYEHCARAVEASLRLGSHGLPLIGTGDWNDGMNRVGREGRGESVWLGWFLCAVLAEMVPLAEARGERERSTRWRDHLGTLRGAIERDGWDGDWYRRAFFDNGEPLGSAVNAECRIDSIAQSWSVLSGAAEPARAARAMAAVDEYLVHRGDGLVLLFTPPFDHSPMDPGYIKGYLPGVRENGGQYTHAAIWTTLAFADLGDGDRAGELFSILNPINHASTRAGVHRYKVEPYVMPADVYAEGQHIGRGGWTWYTASAGWMYQAGTEWILGFRVRGTTLQLDPCIPRAWAGFQVDFRYSSARYEITVENPHGASRGVALIELDGTSLGEGSMAIDLVDDGATHKVRVVLG